MSAARDVAARADLRLPTWRMDRTQLARVAAEHFGWTVRTNWILDDQGVAVGCGWEHVAARLERRGLVRVGSGVNWRQIGATLRLPPVQRSSRGGWA